jgi:hypothetical protein
VRILFFLKNGRRFFQFVLVGVAVLSLLGSLPASVSQSLTTIVTTVTTPITTFEMVESTVGSTRSTSTEFHTIAYTTLFVIQPTGGVYGCVPQAYGPFTLADGEPLACDIASNNPISVYIMSASEYRAWAASNSCSVGSAQYSRDKVTSVYIDMIAPSSGDYYLLLLNFSSTRSASVNVGYTDVSQTVTSVLVPVISEFAVTETQTVMTKLTHVQQVTDPLQQYGFLAVVLALVLVVALLALRRRSNKKATGSVTVAAKQAAPAGEKFCGDCGKPIPVSAKFCPVCGASTDDD